ncbi:hypothetical protein DFH01_25860 [Falsiroseomonas bella]|uniref:DUF669 domain-containing protein n=1 Tax=Falsiroseomonas bella TaxID=2184016 RepID=A0A317F7R7_9PROT|nr:DUF669 domain-containing protein [Falsiroseomonas bella]PWS34443.1 hypothetical protein DFH01_25860 [Falsiroseomonas bella]
MALLNGTFDAGSVEPAKPFEPLPAGKYRAQIVESEMAATRAGDGQMLKLTLEILDGPHAHRKLWDQLNLVNPNSQTMEIAQRTLSAICHATGQMQVSDSEQLHFKPMRVTVKYEPEGNDKHGVWQKARNRIGGYERPDGGPAARPAPAGPMPRPQAPPQVPSVPAPQASAPSRPANSTVPPWRRTG